MSMAFVLLLIFVIGLVSGLRTFTGSAAVTWAAHFGWINLSGSPLSFMGSIWALAIFTILALVEYVTDQLPTTPARTVPMQLGARLATGKSGRCMFGDCRRRFLVVRNPLRRYWRSRRHLWRLSRACRAGSFACRYVTLSSQFRKT